MKTGIITRDIAFFEKLRLNADRENLLSELVYADQVPPKTEASCIWFADMSKSGRVTDTLPDGCAAVLTDRWDTVYPGVPTLVKYRDTAGLLEEMRKIGSGGVAKNSERARGNVRLICVTSASGGTGTSTVAAAAALAAAPESFYLNLEPLPGFCPFSAPAGPDWGTVLYSLQTLPEEQCEAVLSMCGSDRCGVDFFRPSLHVQDTAGLTAGTVQRLLRAFRQSGTYRTVVADCPVSFHGVFESVLSEADAVCAVRTGEGEKQKRFSAFLQSKAADKVREIENLHAGTSGNLPADVLRLPDCGKLPLTERVYRLAEVMRNDFL